MIIQNKTSCQKADVNGLSSGLTSVLESGSFKGFGAAAASGFVSSAISSGIEALGQTDGGFVDGKTGKSIASYNNFGKSDWFKATIIVSGGVSGGLSSTIAGGNFMDGFKQGIITSGLNHVASMGAEAIGNGYDSSISDSKYESLSDEKKSKYTKVPVDALVEEREDTVVSQITQGGTVTVKNTYVTEIWGKMKWVLQKNLVKTINTSKTLYSRFDVKSTTQIFYRTYDYYTSWFLTTMDSIGGVLYPSATFQKTYENKSLYPGGDLSRYLNYFNYLNIPK